MATYDAILKLLTSLLNLVISIITLITIKIDRKSPPKKMGSHKKNT